MTVTIEVSDLVGAVNRSDESLGLAAKLAAEKQRFLDSTKMLDRWQAIVTDWNNGKDQSPTRIRDAINEMAVAEVILHHADPGDVLVYEPRLSGTAKSIDFMLLCADGKKEWIDVKTIAPKLNDSEEAWKRYEMISQDFPPNARLIVAKAMGGPTLSAYMLAARNSMIVYTRQLEEKIATFSDDEKGEAFMFFCGNGFKWQLDDLEDFSDFYRYGVFRPDDWSANYVARFMADRSIVFDQTISGFCYLERPDHLHEPNGYKLVVKGGGFGPGIRYP